MRRIMLYGIGTGLGAGYSPIAPGTAGSLLALVLFALLPAASVVWLLISAVVFFIGVKISTFIEREKGEDPSLVVIDEIVGQWIALLFLPAYSLTVFAGAFFLFRLFDVWKPYPIDLSQKLNGGWGIMVDDVLAGIYANLVLQIVLRSGLLP
ncbi:MAG: phosphatidylglycerophosphatase A [Calditrichaeota bacterium]|nr:phosphatidylglycerophosphatase A [Calditrichota bacterium]